MNTGVAPEPVASATWPNGVTRVSAEQVPEQVLRATVTANNEFGVALFGTLREAAAGENFLTSPISASLALGMTYAGARGQTKSEMARALGWAALAGDSVFQGQNALSQALARRGAQALDAEAQAFRGSAPPPDPSDYRLDLANSLWGQSSYEWRPPFLQTLATAYGAGLFKRDFKQQSQAARVEINRWVSAHTNDKIQDLLPAQAVTGETRLVLVNALHLKLPWDTAFEKSDTAVGPFKRSDGSRLSVPLMHRTAQLAYRDDGSAQIAALPLRSRGLWVIIALPHAGVRLARYERSLRAGSAALVVPSEEKRVALTLPKLTFTSPSFLLTAALRQLGLVRAFDKEQAQFEGMAQLQAADGPLFIGDVVQKTMISLAESGVEAAAATAVVMMVPASAPVRRVEPPPPIPMIVDRPYLLAVVDQPTGALLMLGQIEDPKPE